MILASSFSVAGPNPKHYLSTMAATRRWSVALILALAFLAPGQAIGEKAPRRRPVFVLEMGTVAFATHEPLIMESTIDSLLARLVMLERFVRMEAPPTARRMTIDFVEIENPFRIPAEALPDTIPLRIDLDLEQSRYGPATDSRQDLIGYAALGILSAVTWRSTYAGLVQWRATITGERLKAPIQILAEGAVAGKPQILTRRSAIPSANKRAIYQLGYDIAESIEKEFGLRLQRGNPLESEDSFREIVDNW